MKDESQFPEMEVNLLKVDGSSVRIRAIGLVPVYVNKTYLFAMPK